jgi:hypothetical protein
MADFRLTVAGHNSDKLRHTRRIKKLDLAKITGALLKYEHTTFPESGSGFRAMRNSHCGFINVALRFRQSAMDRKAQA